MSSLSSSCTGLADYADTQQVHVAVFIADAWVDPTSTIPIAIGVREMYIGSTEIPYGHWHAHVEGISGGLKTNHLIKQQTQSSSTASLGNTQSTVQFDSLRTKALDVASAQQQSMQWMRLFADMHCLLCLSEP